MYLYFIEVLNGFKYLLASSTIFICIALIVNEFKEERVNKLYDEAIKFGIKMIVIFIILLILLPSEDLMLSLAH